MTLTFDLEGQHHNVCPLIDYVVVDIFKKYSLTNISIAMMF